MYRNPCGGCNTLGAYDEATTKTVATNGASWWQGPVTQIVGAVSSRIAGPDSGYPPGSYEWDYNRQAYADAPPTYAPAPRGISPTTGLAIAGAALLGLKLTGVI